MLGITLGKVYVSFTLSKQKSFGNGQIYVAIRRERKVSDIYKSGEIEKSVIKAYQDFLDEYERLRKEANVFQFSEVCNEIPNALIIFLNAKGIFKNHGNIAKDDIFQCVTLIFLKETCTSRDNDSLPLQEHFHMYTFLVHNNFSKYKSLLPLFNDNLFECVDFHQ